MFEYFNKNSEFELEKLKFYYFHLLLSFLLIFFIYYYDSRITFKQLNKTIFNLFPLKIQK